MTEHDVTVFEWNSPDPQEGAQMADALRNYLGGLPTGEGDEHGGDALRRMNAERARGILERSGLPLNDPRELWRQIAFRGHAEDTAPNIAAQWLRAWRMWRNARERLLAGEVTPDLISQVADAAEDMGRLQERLWWRAGVDPITGERREALGLRGRNFTRPNKGTQSKTAKRAEFLRTLASDFGTTNHEALAQQAVTEHMREVRGLWDGLEGERARTKILTFLRNHAHLVFES